MSKSKTRKKINNYIVHLDEPLGSGAFATVYKAHDEHSNTLFAVKIIDRLKMQADEYTARCIRLQISIHKSLEHPNIVRVADIVQTTNNYYIFQQYCSGGNLRKLLQEAPECRLSQSDAIYCIKCVCAAFEPMFEKGVVHRDLKPENIVIGDNVLKITDFGFAKALASSRQITRTVIGTPLYMSPQILAKDPYTSKCDIWSIGVILYQMIFGKHPWHGKGLVELYTKIQKNRQVHFPPQIPISQLTKSLIIQCLQFDQNDRLSWMELFQHKIWDNSFHDVALSWRIGYQNAQKRIEELEDTQVEVLVGVFLRVRAPALNFIQFYAIMKSLLGDDLQQKQAGMMYELFDKDSNGVIDLQQFVANITDCPEEPLELLNKLVGAGNYYQKLSDPGTFSQLAKNSPEEVRKAAFAIIANMNF